MTTAASSRLLDLEVANEDRHVALSYVNDAFVEALMAGLDMESFADAAITAGLQELVACYGEDAVANFTARLPERVRRGDFTVGARH